jgi:MoaA/NifB/PqqE/SkfB family radical SAM enzyme
MDIFSKNRERAAPTFANINLLGKCNVDCYFCLGKDIPELLNKHDQVKTHYNAWRNFNHFLHECKIAGIKKIYITGQNTDALVYKYVHELVPFLKERGFMVGMRTNGYLALNKMDAINQCNLSVGYSIHTLKPKVNWFIMKRTDLPDWGRIIPMTVGPRVQIVVNRYNEGEFFDLVRYAASFPNVKYIQARRICTDTRADLLAEDVEVYERVFREVEQNFTRAGNYYTAEIFDMFGKPVCFWRTVETTVNSYNYFTDGTWSKSYFVIESYKNPQQ